MYIFSSHLLFVSLFSVILAEVRADFDGDIQLDWSQYFDREVTGFTIESLVNDEWMELRSLSALTRTDVVSVGIADGVRIMAVVANGTSNQDVEPGNVVTEL